MDRSFLSQAPVISASRRFICIRPLSYENAEEMRFMKALFVGRSGEVENTTFCLLSPDGKHPLTRAGRGIQWAYQTPEQMAEGMDRISEYYAAERRKRVGSAAGPAALPTIPTVRRALNVASADNLPLVVLAARADADRQRLRTTLANLAWREEFIGQFAYVVTADLAELATVDGGRPGVLVVQPDTFGQKGRVLAAAAQSATAAQLADTLRRGLKQYQPHVKSHREHVRSGLTQGVFWETALPVTDPMEYQARERGRRFARPR